MIVDTLDMGADEFQRLTGWEIKPEGACKGELCVPLPDRSASAPFDLVATAQRLGMAMVHDPAEHNPAEEVWAFGPETVTGRALTTTEVGDFALPDLNGKEFALSSLAGQKVLLLAWAPY